MRIIDTEPRNCDLCGSGDLQEIHSYSAKYRTKTDMSIWNVRNVVCRACGFAFVSPAPQQKCLDLHYGDSYELSNGLKPDFSVSKRINLIRKYSAGRPDAAYLEIGSNHCPEFMEALGKTVGRVSTMEINQSCSSSFKSTGEIPTASADIVAAYFVMEHVPSPVRMLSTCSEILKQDGILILEVPNLYLYPDDPAGLLLCEHVNHFSPTTLTAAAKLCGLDLVEFSQASCSRPFGFLAAFKKSPGKCGKMPPNKTEYALAKACMESGIAKLGRLDSKIKEARARILYFSRNGETSIIWSANWICLKLLDDFKLPGNTLIADSDSRKANYVPGHLVRPPSDMIEQISKASYLVLNSAIYADEIKNWIKDRTGRIFTNDDSIVMDYY